MSRAVFVLGSGRSGTSAVAGVLHKLGVPMGEPFVQTTSANSRGTFEDYQLYQLNREYLANGIADFDSWVEERSGPPVWGAKAPTLSYTFNQIWPMLNDARVIVVTRSPAASISSYQRAYDTKLVDAQAWYQKTIDALDEQLSKFPGEIKTVKYEQLLNSPNTVIDKIIDFVFDGIDRPGYLQIDDAISFIEPAMQRYDADGKWIQRPIEKKNDFGSVAVGVRLAKHPEFSFFTDCIALMTGGLRTGDTILYPRGHMPAHWAGDAIVRDFLRTDKDSLLMLDDDMTFPPDSLEKLRSNPENQKYDIVFGFCTFRVWPPKPVVYKLQEPKPEPQSLLGDSFSPALDLIDGEVRPVDAVGLAFTLIKRHVFEAMINPTWGPQWSFIFKSLSREGLFREIVGQKNINLELTSFFSYGEAKESDDIPWSRVCRELGFTMAVDTNVKIGHIGHLPLGWEDYQRWLKTKDTKEVDLDIDKLKRVLENSDTDEARELLELIS